MQAVFNLKRESDKNLYFNGWTNDKGVFGFHSQIELYFVDDGEMEVFVNDRHTILKKGEMSVALSYVPHGYKTPEHSASSALIIPLKFCEKFVSATKNRRASEPFIRDKATVAKIKAVFDELRAPDLNELEIRGYVYVILGMVMKCLKFDEAHQSADDTLASKILLFANENCKSAISTVDVARKFGYSSSYVSRYFKDKLGITLGRYLTIVRLGQAIMMLQEGKYSVTYCALECGFGSVRSFYRAFSAEFGCSPKEYLQKSEED